MLFYYKQIALSSTAYDHIKSIKYKPNVPTHNPIWLWSLAQMELRIAIVLSGEC